MIGISTRIMDTQADGKGSASEERLGQIRLHASQLATTPMLWAVPEVDRNHRGG